MSTFRTPRVESIELIDKEKRIFRGVIGYDFRNKRGAHVYLESFMTPYIGNSHYGWIRCDGGVLAPDEFVALLDEASKATFLKNMFGEKLLEPYSGLPVKKVLLEKQVEPDEVQLTKQDRREEIKRQRIERMKNK